MAKLMFPRRFKGQPNQPALLNQNHPLYPSIVFAWSCGRGTYQDARHAYQFGSIGTPLNTIVPGAGRFGRSVSGFNSASCVNFSGSIPDHTVIGDITLISRIRTYTDFSAVAAIIAKISSNGTIQTPYQLLTGTNAAASTGYIGISRAGASSYRSWGSGQILVPRQECVVAATHTGNIENPPLFYLNGTLDTSAYFSVGGGTGPVTGPSANLRMIGNGVSWGCLNDVYDVLVCNQVLSAAQVKQISWDMDSLWVSPRVSIMATASAPRREQRWILPRLTARPSYLEPFVSPKLP